MLIKFKSALQIVEYFKFEVYHLVFHSTGESIYILAIYSAIIRIPLACHSFVSIWIFDKNCRCLSPAKKTTIPIDYTIFMCLFCCSCWISSFSFNTIFTRSFSSAQNHAPQPHAVDLSSPVSRNMFYVRDNGESILFRYGKLT